MSGEIVVETIVTVRKKGSLEGNVTAKAFIVEKGGMFSGQLIIGQAGLSQGELLPDQKPTGASKMEDDVTVIAPQPAPAT